jgi:hypothetical protein
MPEYLPGARRAIQRGQHCSPSTPHVHDEDAAQGIVVPGAVERGRRHRYGFAFVPSWIFKSELERPVMMMYRAPLHAVSRNGENRYLHSANFGYICDIASMIPSYPIDGEVLGQNDEGRGAATTD